MTDGEIERMVEDVRSIADPAERAERAQQLQRDAVAAKTALAVIRAEAVRELRAKGWSHRDIGRLLKVTRGTAQSIAEGRSLARDGDDAPQS